MEPANRLVENSPRGNEQPLSINNDRPTAASSLISPAGLLIQAYTTLQEALIPPARKLQGVFEATLPLLDLVNPLRKTKETTPLAVEASQHHPAFRHAAVCAWSVNAFEEVMKGVDWPAILPGPGNGYFEAIRILLIAIDDLALVLEYPRINQHEQLDKFFKAACFQNLPLNPNTQYPVEIYFLALNLWLRDVKEKSQEVHFSDLWTVSLQLSEKTRQAGLTLKDSTQGLITVLRKGEQKTFLESFKKFDESWGNFLNQLIWERQSGEAWIGSLHLDITVKGLTSSERVKSGYLLKLEEFNRAIKTFRDGNPSLSGDGQLLDHIKYELHENLNLVKIEKEGPISSKPLIIKAIKQTIKDSYLKASLEKSLSAMDPAFYQLIPQLACIELSKALFADERCPDIFKKNLAAVNKIIGNIAEIRLKSDYALHVLRRSIFTYTQRQLCKEVAANTSFSSIPILSLSYQWVSWLIPWLRNDPKDMLPPLAGPPAELAEVAQDIQKLGIDKDLFNLGTLINETQSDLLLPIIQEIFKNHKIITLIPVIQTQILAKKIVRLGMHTLEVSLYPGVLEERKITDVEKQ